MRNKLFILNILMLVAVFWAAPAAAQAVPASCDAQLWGVMQNKATMEGRRELEMYQTILRKPDSVMGYSCYYHRINQLGGFSSFTDDVDDALEDLVQDALVEYFDENFNHSFGGGGGAPGGGTCEHLPPVWRFMRCTNFDIDSFDTFMQLAANDPRQLYEPCPGAGARTSQWNAMITAANPVAGSPGGGDIAFTMLNLLNPADCASSPAVPTGVIANVGGAEHPDAVCTAPSCRYNPGAGACVP